MTDVTLKIAQTLPKTELHIHLDGSVSEQLIASRAKHHGFPLPCPPDGIREYLFKIKTEYKEKMMAPGFVLAKNANWPHFDFVNKFLQTKEDLEEGTADICRTLISQNVKLAEIRFCPSLHQQKGLTVDEIVESVVNGFKKGAGDKLVGGIIICALRSYEKSHFQEMIDLTKRWLSKPTSGFNNGTVVGFDVAGDEGSYPLSCHADLVKLACESGIPVTCHAGEWPNSIQNIKLAVELGVHRLGHALTLRDDPVLLKEVATKKIAVECCVIANHGMQGRSWHGKHPIRDMFNAGISVSINSDNQLLSGSPTMFANTNQDVVHMVHELGFSWDEIKTVLKNGVQAAFTKVTPEWKSQFENELNEAIKAAQKQ